MLEPPWLSWWSARDVPSGLRGIWWFEVAVWAILWLAVRGMWQSTQLSAGFCLSRSARGRRTLVPKCPPWHRQIRRRDADPGTSSRLSPPGHPQRDSPGSALDRRHHARPMPAERGGHGRRCIRALPGSPGSSGWRTSARPGPRIDCRGDARAEDRRQCIHARENPVDNPSTSGPPGECAFPPGDGIAGKRPRAGAAPGWRG